MLAPGAICGPIRLGKELLNNQDLSMVAPQHMDLIYLANAWQGARGGSVTCAREVLWALGAGTPPGTVLCKILRKMG